MFASSLGLRADRIADFTEQEIDKLQQFQAAYEANCKDWFRGKSMLAIIFELVALRSDRIGSTSGETSICVRGLRSEYDIKLFHEVMSQTGIRRLYSGLRLSYDQSGVTRPAREVNEDHFAGLPLGETLCGTQLVTRRQGEGGKWIEWSSTIGGIVQVDDALYAMTSPHKADDDDAQSRPASRGDGSRLSTLVDADYDDAVESALILDLPPLSESVSSRDNAAGKGVAQEPPSYLSPALITGTRATLEDRDNDWRLVPLAASHCFPNSVQQPLEHTSKAKTTYLTEPLSTRPSRRHVSILAGFSGRCGGTLLSSPAFLSIRGAAPTKV